MVTIAEWTKPMIDLPQAEQQIIVREYNKQWVRLTASHCTYFGMKDVRWLYVHHAYINIGAHRPGAVRKAAVTLSSRALVLNAEKVLVLREDGSYRPPDLRDPYGYTYLLRGEKPESCKDEEQIVMLTFISMNHAQ